jgi:alpha-ketoglutarate-dependent taurine dioxygenase
MAEGFNKVKTSFKKKFFDNGYVVIDFNANDKIALYNNFQLYGKEIGNFTQSDAGRRKTLDLGGNKLKSVDLDFPHVNPHSENSFSPARPAIISFLCLDIENSAAERGKTTLIDGRDLWKSLTLKSRQVLLSVKIEHGLEIDIQKRAKSKDAYRDWYLDYPGVIHPRINQFSGKLSFLFVCNYVGVHPLSNELSIANHSFIDIETEPQIKSRRIYSYSDEYSEHDVFHAIEEVMTSVGNFVKCLQWKKGRAIYIDNYRFMHGRLPYTMSEKRDIYIEQFKKFRIY